MSLGHPSTFVKTTLMKEYLFDTSYKIAADYHFLAQLYYNEKKFEYLNENLSFFRKGGTSSLNYLTVYEGYKVALTLAKEYQCGNDNLLREIDNRCYSSFFSYACNRGDMPNGIVSKYMKALFINKVCYVFGCGIRGKRIIKILQECDIKILGILDNSSSESDFDGILIMQPCVESIDKYSPIVITPKNAFGSIRDQLMGMGVLADRIIDMVDIEIHIGKAIHDSLFGK